MNFTWIYKTGF